MSPHCLLVEDHAQAQEWLSRAVEAAFGARPVVRATVRDAINLINARMPEVALIDLGLPDGSGIQVIEHLIKVQQPGDEPMIVVSTVMNDDESIFNALRAGASGYVLKDESRSELVSMLQGISSGRPPLSPQIASRVLAYFHQDAGTEHLSKRETETLTLLARGLTVPEVAAEMDITRNTAQGYVKEIYRKLKVSSRAEATRAAVRRGLV